MVLPQDLRSELRAALASLFDGAHNAAIEQDTYARLHKTLSHLAGNYNYPAILEALQTNHMVNVI